MTIGNGQLVRADRQTVMGSMAERYSMDPIKLLETIKATCIKGAASNEQVQAFLIVANRYGLDPFLKEIHAFAGQGGGIVPIVGIDGWSKIANNTGKLDGIEFSFDGEGPSLACTCTIHVKERQHPTRVTEYFAECGRGTPPWKQYPRRMLRHKAFMQCVRIAFGLGGIYDEDEARDIQGNEGGHERTGIRRLDELNAAVVPHPADTSRVIDTTTSNLPTADVAEEILRNAPRAPETQEDDTGGDGPAMELANLTFESFLASAQEIAQDDKISPDVFDAAIAKLKLSDGIGGGRRKDTDTRNKIRRAMLDGQFDWVSARVVV